MGSMVLRKKQPDKDLLEKQLDYCLAVTGKMRDFVTEYLHQAGIYSLESVNRDDLINYRKYVDSIYFIQKTRQRVYKSLLEQVTFSFLIAGNNVFTAQAEEIIKERAVRNKTVGFLLLNGVADINEINYDLRKEYEDYLTDTLAESKKTEYIKALDNLKLESIKRESKHLVDNAAPFKKSALKYDNSKIFLLYHPSYDIAMTLYWVRDKEELVFDFSTPAPGMMKRQIFKMLNHVLETVENWHDRRERFMIPLKLFYEFCISRQIEDIEQITEAQVQDFRSCIAGNTAQRIKIFMQIVDNIRKYLFLSAPEINWDANAWYLERFHFEDGRKNPAREVKKFRFGQIRNVQNRNLFKQYMKYQLGVSQKSSIQTIRGQYYDINAFLNYLDERELSVENTEKPEIEGFLDFLEEKDRQPDGFNRLVISLARFYGYLLTVKAVPTMPLHFSYYFKKTFPYHNNRSVPLDIQISILKKLKEFPEHLRLMYLNLWCIGLRESEVCIIRGDSYYWDGQDAWIRIYQSKMKKEKSVPIPAVLYEFMQQYIIKNGIHPDDYVFQNKRGGAYNADTFSKQFKSKLEAIGMEGYSFKSHDFRHTVATFLYQNDTSIEVIRDYLGHKESDMTRQYIDYMEQELIKASELYFGKHKNRLAEAVKKGMRNNE